MSLKLRISLLVSGLLVLAIGGLTGFLIWSEKKALADEMRKSHQLLAERLANVCRDAVVNQHFLPLNNYLLSMAEDAEVREAMCLDPEGKVIGHSDLRRIDTFIKKDAVDPRIHSAGAELRPGIGDGSLLESWAPVDVDGRRLATARVVLSRAALEDRLQKGLARARRRILEASLPVLLAGFLAAFLITAMVLGPLKDLVRGARTIGSGNLEHRIPELKRDEVGVLSHEFNQMAEKLKELDRMKQDFVSSVTHDLKSPIASVKIALEALQGEIETLLRGAPAPRRVGESFLYARDGLERLTHLIGSLLDVARIESLLALDRRPVNLEALAERVVRSFELIARQKGLELMVMIDSQTRGVQGDEAKLERALANLVSNAVKFTEKGSVVVHLADKGAEQEVRVADTGPGIPPEAMGRLFSKFFRASRGAGKTPQEGTGLGLAIAKGYVEAHGGRVDVESRVGRGTVFTVRLPTGGKG